MTAARRPRLLSIVAVVVVVVLAATALLPRSAPTKALACAGKDAKSGLAVGECAPGFALHDLRGRRVALTLFRGSPLLLHFWAVGCTTCAGEYPDFSRAVRAYTAKGLRVVAVDAWGESQPLVQDWQNSHHLPATLLVDPSQAVPSMYSGTHTPTTYLIDRAGRVAYAHTGPLSYAGFQQQIDRVM